MVPALRSYHFTHREGKEEEGEGFSEGKEKEERCYTVPKESTSKYTFITFVLLLEQGDDRLVAPFSSRSPAGVQRILQCEERSRRPVVLLGGEVQRGRAGTRIKYAVVSGHGDTWVGAGREKQRDALAMISKGGTHERGRVSGL